jgi:hypothetical protein
MFIFFGILPRIHKSHAAEPNGSADPRLGTPGLDPRLNETLNYISIASLLITVRIKAIFVSVHSCFIETFYKYQLSLL